MKFLEENIGKKLQNIGFGHDFLDMTPHNIQKEQDKSTCTDVEKCPQDVK